MKMGYDDVAEPGTRVGEVARQLSGVAGNLVEGEPIGTWVSVLSLNRAQIRGPPVNPGRGTCLEAFYCKSKCLNNLCKFYRRPFTGSPGRELSLQPKMDPPSQEGPRREHDCRCKEPPAVYRFDPPHSAALNQKIGNCSLGEFQVRLSLEQLPYRTSIETSITLGSRRPDGGALGSVEHSELNPSPIGRATHDAAECVHFAHDGTLGNPADGRIARHLANGLEVLGDEQRARAESSGKRRRFCSGVATADHDYIEAFRHT